MKHFNRKAIAGLPSVWLLPKGGLEQDGEELEMEAQS